MVAILGSMIGFMLGAMIGYFLGSLVLLSIIKKRFKNERLYSKENLTSLRRS